MPDPAGLLEDAISGAQAPERSRPQCPLTGAEDGENGDRAPRSVRRPGGYVTICNKYAALHNPQQGLTHPERPVRPLYARETFGDLPSLGLKTLLCVALSKAKKRDETTGNEAPPPASTLPVRRWFWCVWAYLRRAQRLNACPDSAGFEPHRVSAAGSPTASALLFLDVLDVLLVEISERAGRASSVPGGDGPRSAPRPQGGERACGAEAVAVNRRSLPKVLQQSENLEFNFEVKGTSYTVRTRSCPLCDEWDDGMSYGFAVHLLVEHEVQDLPGFEPIPEECDE